LRIRRGKLSGFQVSDKQNQQCGGGRQMKQNVRGVWHDFIATRRE
jgi:hypothetical protein